jgi:hypothetical protein
MSKIAGDQHQVGGDGGGGDLQICVWQDVPLFLQPGSNLAEYFCCFDVVGQHRDCGQHLFLYMAQMAIAIRGAESAFVELADANSARKLKLSVQGHQPLQVARGGSRPEELGNSVRIE